jgi:hypothetical protein
MFDKIALGNCFEFIAIAAIFFMIFGQKQNFLSLLKTVVHVVIIVAVSNSNFHFTVLYPISFKECQLAGMEALKLLILLSAIKDLDCKHLTGEISKIFDKNNERSIRF